MLAIIFHLLHKVTNKEQCKKLLCNEFSHCGKLKQSHIVLSPQSTPCVVSKKKTETQRRTKIYALRLAKRYTTGQSDIGQQKIKPIALSIVELCLAEAISHVVRRYIISIETCWKVWIHSKGIYRLYYTKPILSSCYEGNLRLVLGCSAWSLIYTLLYCTVW